MVSTQIQPLLDRLLTTSMLVREFGAVLQPDRLLGVAAQRTRNLLGFDHVAVFTLAQPNTPTSLQLSAASSERDALRFALPVAPDAGHTAQWVALHRQPSLSRGREVGERPLSHDLLPNARAEFSVPIADRTDLYGVLTVQAQHIATLDANQQQVIQLVAEHLALAFRNAYAVSAERRRTERLLRANQIVLQLSDMQYDLDAVYELVLTQGRELLAADDVGIWLPVVGRTDRLELVVTHRKDKAALIGRQVAVGEGVAGKVFASGTALQVPDYRQWPDRSPEFADVPMRAVIGAPIAWRDAVLGVLVAANTESTAQFSDDDLLISRLIAGHVGAAIEHNQLLDETRDRVTELFTLNRLTATLTGETNLARLYALVADQIAQIFGVRNLVIATYDAARNLIEVPYLKEEDELVPVPPFELGPGLVSYIIRTREPLHVVNNVAERFAELNALSAGRADMPRSYMGVPMIVRDSVIGAVAVQDFERDQAFTLNDVNLLTTIASQIGLALLTARLVNQTEQRARRLQAIAEIGQVIINIRQPQAMLARAVDLIRERFDLYYTGIFLVDADREWANLVVGTGEAGQRQLARNHRLAVGSNSMIGRATLNGDAQIALDVGQAAVRFENPDLPDTRSELALPFRTQATVAGAVTIQSTQPLAFSTEDIAVFQVLADQIGTGYQNAILYAQSQRQFDELSAISRVGQQIVSSLDLDTILTSILDEALPLTGATYGSIALYDAERQTMTVQALRGYPPARSRELIGLALDTTANSLHARVVQTGQAILVNDVSSNPAYLAWANDVQSEFIAPIQQAGVLVGALNLESPHRHQFDDNTRRQVSALADQAAIAVQNARLFRGEQQQREAAAGLLSILTVVTSTLDLKELLTEVAQRTAQALKATRAMVFLLDPSGQQLLPAAAQFADGHADADLWRRFSKRADVTISAVPLIETLLREAKPRVFDNLPEATGLPGQWRAFTSESRTLLIAPLVSRDTVIGLLGIDDASPTRRFNPNDVELAMSIGRQVAIAIETARLTQQTEQALAETEALYEASRRLTAAGSLDAILNTLAYNTRLKDFEQAQLLFFDTPWQDTPPTQFNTAAVWAKSGLPDHRYLNQPRDFNSQPLLALCERDNLLYMADLLQADLNPELRAHAMNLSQRSVAIAPLVSGGVWFGVVLAQASQPVTLSDIDQRRLRSLADQSSSVVQSQRLFQQTQDALRETRALYDGGRRLRAAGSDVQTMLAAVVESQPLMGVQRAMLLVVQYQAEIPVGLSVVVGWHSGRGLPPLAAGPLPAQEHHSLLPVVMRSTPTLLNDLPNSAELDSNTLALFAGQGTLSLAVLPMRAANRQIGAVVLESDDVAAFDENELKPLTTLAGELAFVYSNYQLLNETQRAFREVNALLQVSRQVGSLDLQTVLRSVLESTVSAVEPADVGMIVLHNARSGQLYIESAYGYPNARALEGRQLDMTKSIAGEVYRSREIRRFNVTDLIDSPRAAGGFKATAPVNTSHQQVVSQVAVPIQRSNVPLGVLMLGSRQRPDAFSDTDLALIENLAGQMAVAIENARLFSQTQQLARRQQTINEITTRMRQATTPDAVLNNALAELQTVLGAQRSRARLLTRTTIDTHPASNGGPTARSTDPTDSRS